MLPATSISFMRANYYDSERIVPCFKISAEEGEGTRSAFAHKLRRDCQIFHEMRCVWYNADVRYSRMD
jgi:hypothetical protein